MIRGREVTALDENTFRAPEPEDHDLQRSDAASEAAGTDDRLREDHDLPGADYISHASAIFNFTDEPELPKENAAAIEPPEPLTRVVTSAPYSREDPLPGPDDASRSASPKKAKRYAPPTEPTAREPAFFPEEGPIPPFLAQKPVSPIAAPVSPAPVAEPGGGRPAAAAPDASLMPEPAAQAGRRAPSKRFYVLLALCLSLAAIAAGAVLFFLLHGNPFAKESARINVPTAMPQTTEEIVDFYRIAANAVAQNGMAGFRKKQWQTVTDLNLTGIELVDGIVNGMLRQYVTPEEKARSETFSKETSEAKEAFPAFTLKDLSYVRSAECTRVGENYQLTIVFQHEDTPRAKDSFLGQATNAVIFWDTQIEPILGELSQLRAYEDVHVDFHDVTIAAEISSNGKFLSLRHTAPAEITIGSARVGIFTFSDKSMHLDSVVAYSDFNY